MCFEESVIYLIEKDMNDYKLVDLYSFHQFVVKNISQEPVREVNQIEISVMNILTNFIFNYKEYLSMILHSSNFIYT